MKCSMLFLFLFVDYMHFSLSFILLKSAKNIYKTKTTFIYLITSEKHEMKIYLFNVCHNINNNIDYRYDDFYTNQNNNNKL